MADWPAANSKATLRAKTSSFILPCGGVARERDTEKTALTHTLTMVNSFTRTVWTITRNILWANGWHLQANKWQADIDLMPLLKMCPTKVEITRRGERKGSGPCLRTKLTCFPWFQCDWGVISVFLLLLYIPICPTRLIKSCSAEPICSVFTSMKPTHQGTLGTRVILSPWSHSCITQQLSTLMCQLCLYVTSVNIKTCRDSNRDFFYQYLCSRRVGTLAREQDVPVDDELHQRIRLQFTALHASSSQSSQVSKLTKNK